MYPGITVIKRNGRREPLDISKIRKYTKAACEGLEGVDYTELELDAKLQFRDGITTAEIQDTLIKTAVDKIDIDRPNWNYVAARLFLYDLYHRVTGFTGYNHLKEYFEKGENAGRILLGLKEKYDLDDLNSYIKPERDLQFTYLGIKTLYDRYIIKDRNNEPIELPQQLFMGVAMFLAQNETNYESVPEVDRNEIPNEPKAIRGYWAKKFYDVISKFEVMVATPTLSNARTTRHQLSSCYVGSMNDNIEGIFDDFKEMALLSKFGGGIGWDVSRIRALGSFIDNHKNAAGGVIPWLKITNDIAIAVDQLGTRKGAIAVYLEPWHMDILDFLDLKKNSGEERRRAHDLFPALWISDLFMKRVEEDALWTLFDPYEVQDLTDLYGEEFEKKYIEYENDPTITKETIKAKELWKKILLEYYETGNPFLCFKDNANRRNQNDHAGIIRSSNLCVTGDTRLATQFGLIRADELEKMQKEIIATYDYRVEGDRKAYGVGFAQCIKMYKTKENAEIYEIKTKDGYKIKATSWHEFYVLRDKKIIKIPLREIKLTDKLLIQSAKGQFGKEGSYELGLLIGLITGDGTFSINHSDYQVAHIDLYNEDIALKDIVKEAIEEVVKEYKDLDKHINKEIENKMPEIINHTQNSKKMRFSNVRLGRILDEKYNFNKDTKLKVPEIIFRAKEEAVEGYLQGLFSADASVNKIKNDGIPTFAIQLASISKELLEDVQILLSNFGIRSKITKMRDVGESHFEYKDKQYISKALYRLNINGRNATKFVEEIGFLGVKQQKALEIMLERVQLGYSEYSRKSESFEVEIESIEYVGKEDVYDTTQLLNHSLIFNGIITGNCTEIFQNTEPNHYKVKVTFEDGSFNMYDEEEDVAIEHGDVKLNKKAKKITSIDVINGKQVYIVEKVPIFGKTAVCNLASVNLSRVNTPEKIKEVVPVAIRMLDNVIDLNYYPVRKTKDTNLKNRAIGLGAMGEAQMLAEKQIFWGSDEHLKLIDEVFEGISYWAIKTSAALAGEKGIYPEFEGSRWSKGILPIDSANEEAKRLVERDLFTAMQYDWESLREEVKKGMRNGYLMAIAPTSSISILTGTTQTIEPVYKRKWYEENLSGLIPVVVPNLSAETYMFYTPAYELEQTILVKAAAIRQKWIDQGQSLNIFITTDKASGRYLNEIYMLGWKLGLKSFYYLRSQSPEVKEEVMDRSIECFGCQ
jgi:ribonucleotide reductase alpha subunit